MAREESYKRFFFVSCHSDEKAGNQYSGDSVKTVKRHEKNAGQNDEILSAFFKIGTIAVLVNIVLFTTCYTKCIQDYGLTVIKVKKSLTI
mgnify:CR=1 FL=1